MLSWRFGLARLCTRPAHTIVKSSTFCTSRQLRDGDKNWARTVLQNGKQLVTQVLSGSSVDQGQDDLEDAKELKGRITRLEAQLKTLQQGLQSSGIPSFAQFSDAEKVELAKALKNGETSLADRSGAAAAAPANVTRSLPSSPSPGGPSAPGHFTQRAADLESLTIQLPLFEEDDVSLARLNACLRHAAENVSDGEARKELWRWYSRCKQSLPSLLYIMPESAWQVLWTSQQRMSRSNPDRAAHLRVLAEDIITSGQSLDDGQKLVYIDSLFTSGQVGKALQEWESNIESLGADAMKSEGFWALGIRMYSTQGLAQKAQDIADEYLLHRGGRDVRVLTLVIAAWTRQHDESGFRQAWTLYVRFKAQLGEGMTMEDYDNISMSFMNAGRTDLALAVFRDMMLTGSASAEESEKRYSRALRAIGNLQTSSADVSEVNAVSTSAITVLPRKFQNKFFYGSWLKKLLGMGEVNAAAMVVELMYERGIKPDAKHLNGIIGAWIRVGDDEPKRKAERMGWAMIQERLDFVRRRHGKDEPGTPAIDPTVRGLDEVRIPPFLQRTVAPATVETFSILVLYYSRRALYDTVEYITKLLAKAEIPPNTYFMNHLLYSELRKRDYNKAWTLFSSMSQKVKPDLETFACLWDCEKQVLDTSRVPMSGYFPHPRRLFKAMMAWYSKASSRNQSVVQDELTKDLYDQIIRCFSLSKDLEGTLVAMHAMKHYFGMYPDADTARMIALHVSRIGSPDNPRRSRRSRQAGSANSKANVSKVTKVLEMLTERRLKALQERGMRFEDLDQEQQAEEQLYLMSQLLRVVMDKVRGDSSTAGENVDEKTAWDMGVGGITLGDPLDFT